LLVFDLNCALNWPFGFVRAGHLPFTIFNRIHSAELQVLALGS